MKEWHKKRRRQKTERDREKGFAVADKYIQSALAGCTAAVFALFLSQLLLLLPLCHCHLTSVHFAVTVASEKMRECKKRSAGE